MSGNQLPTNATAWESAIADAIDDLDPLAEPAERIRSAKLVSPPSDFVPFLIAEYGLGELTPYVVNHYDLLRDGVKWQRMRGTPAAVALGLSWMALSAAIVEARHDRRFWNSFQLYLTTLPVADAPDLERIENVAGLSVAIRSKLRRGVHGYDVPMMVTDRKCLDGTLLDTDSGVAIRPDQARWSFGRAHEIDHVLTEGEGQDLGNWIEPPPDGEALATWLDLNFPWLSAGVPWNASAGSARRYAMAGWFAGRQAYLRLSGVNGVIGYRRAKGTVLVNRRQAGKIVFGGQRYAPGGTAELVYVEALTGFGDGLGGLVTNAALIFGAAIDAKPGTLWLPPAAVTGGIAIAGTDYADPIELRATVRQRFTFLLRF